MTYESKFLIFFLYALFDEIFTDYNDNIET